jgi:hypothetical protein
MPRGYAPAIPSGEITAIVQGGPSLGRSASRGSPRPITSGGSREDEARRRFEGHYVLKDIVLAAPTLVIARDTFAAGRMHRR